MSVITGPIFPSFSDSIFQKTTDLVRTLSESVQDTVNAIDERFEVQDRFHDTIDFLSDYRPVFIPQFLEELSTPTTSKATKKTNTDPKITPDSRVLIIGDSQTVGPYGQTLDELARGTGASVVTHASWGSSPEWFFSGQPTNYKYWNRDEAGHSETKMKVATPLLQDLLEQEKPDVVVVTMGGNMIASNASQASVTMQVSQIGNAVSASGAELVWVGPPKYDPQKRTPEVVENFYQKLENIVPEFGTLIDSRPHVKKYSGNDGLHYTGRKGRRIAQQWANGVFKEIQQLD